MEQANPPDVMTGRFIRLFPEYRVEIADHDLDELADAMTSGQEEHIRAGETDPEEDPDITAAYTYLGQFTDHDLTFDPTSRLREALTDQQLNALADFRTPRFDLDNLYGRGPADQPYLYHEDGIRMQLGARMSGSPIDLHARDLPRGPNHRALIGDPRNDENRIVAQLHAIFLRFHNQVFDDFIKTNHGRKPSFEYVRSQVRWHYQWLLVRDFLPKIINERTYRRVFADPYYPTPTLPALRDGLRLMPVEFSVAAFRFGHSMIRPDYQLNEKILQRPIFSPGGDGRAPARADDDLGGFRPIPGTWAIDWRYFIRLEPGPDEAEPKPQQAYKIDTSLARPLRYLPSQVVSDERNLARRNLERDRTFSLPTGQQVARALDEEPIADERLVIGKAIAKEWDDLPLLRDIAPGLAGRAPLWAYILSEAQVTSRDRAGGASCPESFPIKLGPVGGRIVADVFAALLRGDPMSYLNRGAPFTPDPKFTRNGEFGLAQLINVALGRAP